MCCNTCLFSKFSSRNIHIQKKQRSIYFHQNLNSIWFRKPHVNWNLKEILKMILPRLKSFILPSFWGENTVYVIIKQHALACPNCMWRSKDKAEPPLWDPPLYRVFPTGGSPLTAKNLLIPPPGKIPPPPPLNFYFPPPKVNYPSPLPQCCNLTLAWWFWATKVCLQASKISKICLFGRPNGWATSWKVNFENYSRYSLIKFYQFLLI